MQMQKWLDDRIYSHENRLIVSESDKRNTRIRWMWIIVSIDSMLAFLFSLAQNGIAVTFSTAPIAFIIIIP